MKICPKCNKRKKFNKNRARFDGLDSWCAACQNKKQSIYYNENPDKQREKKRHFEDTHPTYMREYQLRTKYGLTEEKFKHILNFQGHKCAICKTSNPGGRWKVWQIDHDHIKNIVRGLLCFNCNKHLGFYERIAPHIISYLFNPPATEALKGI